MDTIRPVVFVPHGSPMFALQPGAAGAALSALVERLETPRAIVVVSPHWETTLPTIGSARQLETLHDFGGFDERLYTLRYPATGCPEAAQQVMNALKEADLPALSDSLRGLDHGAWVPLRHMFPHAEIPIVPLSIQHPGGPRHAHRVGQALAPLAERGFLILCSGSITHNLRDWQAASRQNLPTPAYVQEFADWVHTQICTGQTDALLDYRSRQDSGVRAHPRDEHLLPLFTAIGAAGPSARGEAFYRGVSDHVIAMDGYVFH